MTFEKNIFRLKNVFTIKNVINFKNIFNQIIHLSHHEILPNCILPGWGSRQKIGRAVFFLPYQKRVSETNDASAPARESAPTRQRVHLSHHVILANCILPGWGLQRHLPLDVECVVRF